MTSFVLAAVVLVLVTVALLTRPWWWRPASASAARARGWRVAAVGLFVGGVAATGYWMLRPAAPVDEHAGHDHAPASPRAAASAPDPAQLARVDQMAERMKSQPQDAQGWLLLARAQVAVGRHADAVASFRKTTALRAPDAGVLVDMAYAVAMSNGRRLQGEPVELVERALALEANHPKALALAGTAAFDGQDYAGALKHWEALARSQPADGPLAEQLRVSMAEARRLGGMKVQASQVVAPAQVSGTVRLADRLKDRVSPDDTVFVFARAVEGSRMPLAILRKQVKDLPLRFTLDDGMAMSPAAKLSGVSQVVVGARVAKGGQAIAQPGDLQGFTKPVAVGSRGLTIEIDSEVGKAP
jgi:cytochrome c-type biogenesis protein CcmH